MDETAFAAFEARWQAATARPADGRIVQLVVRTGNGEHATPARVELSPEAGVHGDRWGQKPGNDVDAQVSFIDRRVIETIAGEGAELHRPGDNVVVALDLDEAALPVGTRLRLGTALVEITGKLHSGCSKFRARMGDEALRWINAAPNRPRRLRGVFGRVLQAGSVAVGDRVIVGG